ncbi:glycerol uptake facilitator protein [Paramecium bursaria Chlorella virus NE-JV-1]|nr:glycerol uptake facilitator protein [Paramecium bursaria Chlorella virus NE-JV-1]
MYALWQIFLSEFLSSTFALFVGLGVVANEHLNKTKGNEFGFGFVAFGFGMAFAIPLVIFGFVSAHLNPAMSLALFVLKKIDAIEALVCIGGEFLGMFVGATLTFLLYFPHFRLPPEIDAEIASDELVVRDQKRKLAVFATGPAVKIHWSHSFFVEVVCTTVLIASALGVYSRHEHIENPEIFAMYRNIEGLTIGWLVFVLVLALGGITSIAANPSRDFSPRLVHLMMPIENKGSSNWSYAWIPFFAPFVGGVIGAYLFKAISAITEFYI